MHLLNAEGIWGLIIHSQNATPWVLLEAGKRK
jgi:hypothetical protein